MLASTRLPMPAVKVSESFWVKVAWIENFAAPADNLARAELTLVSELWIVEISAEALAWVEIVLVVFNVTIKTTNTISTQARASALISVIQTSLTNVNSALAKLSSGAAKFSIQSTFTQKLSDTLTAGIGNLVDANMAQESATLQSLQVKQQLGVQALSIANQAPQTILSLFH